MAGLLDFLNTGDPQRDAAISRGLLTAGLQLMQSKGKFLPALSQGGMAGLGGYEHEVNRQLAAKRIGLQDQYLANQIDTQKREAELAKLPNQFYTSGQGVDATGGMDTDASNPNNIGSPSFDLPGYIKALYSKAPVQALQLQQAVRKQGPTAHTVAADGKIVFTDESGRVVSEITNPKPTEEKLTDDMREFEFAQKRGEVPAGVTFTEWMRGNKKAGATNIAINPEKAFLQALGPIAAKTIEASHDAATAAQSSNATISNIRESLSKGNVILGPGSEVRRTGMRIGQILGVGGKGSAESLANTKAVEQGLAQIELDAAQLMKGQGQITEAERAIIRRAAAGDIQSLTVSELDVALKAIERNNTQKINTHNSRMKNLPQSSGPLNPLLQAPPPPQATPRVRRYNPETGLIE
jgi:hypothetical protein